jgi:hypothetical protein
VGLARFLMTWSKWRKQEIEYLMLTATKKGAEKC